jgi:hypothetical protein
MDLNTAVSVPPRSTNAEQTPLATAFGAKSLAATDVPTIATLPSNKPEMDRFTALLPQGAAGSDTAQTGYQ